MKEHVYKIFIFGLSILLLSTSIVSAMTIQIKKTTVENNVNINRATLKQKVCNNDNSIYQLLIIAPKKFSATLQPLVNHKNSLGVSTRLVTLTEVYDHEFWGRDEPEKIKYFIRDAIENWGIKYVLLVGGMKNHFSLSEKWWLPVRYTNIEDNYGAMEKRCISDLYYADIYDAEGNFSSWDDNGNNIFGEWLGNDSADDFPELHPDVYVGRLPCRNTIEVKTMVNKIINYEKEKCSNSWFRNMVVVAGDTYTKKNDYYEGEIATQQALDKMPDFNHIRLWTSWGTLTGYKDVMKAINYGCGFLYFAGHGSPTSWATHPPKDGKTWIYGLDLAHIRLLSNREKLPICIVGGCHNSMFNVSFFHSSWTQGIPCLECWSWLLTRKIGGGSIATIGNTGLGYTPEDKKDPSKGGGSSDLEVRFFEEYGQNGVDILGELWGKSIDAYLKNLPINWDEKSFNDTALDAKTVQQWTLIGDPSLKIGGYEQNSSILSAL